MEKPRTDKHSVSRGISDQLADIINEYIKEIVLEGASYDQRKKWLVRCFTAEKADYPTFEESILLLVDEFGKEKLNKKTIRKLAKSCYITQETTDEICDELDARRENTLRSTLEAERLKAEKELLEAAELARNELEEQKRKEEEKEKQRIAAENQRINEEKDAKEKLLDQTWAAVPSHPYLLFRMPDLKTPALTVIGQKKSSESFPKALKIPSSIFVDGTEFNVTSIGDGAFEGCDHLSSVSIPLTMKTIGYNAFYGCKKLKSVDLECEKVDIRCNSFDNTPFRNGKYEALVKKGVIRVPFNDCPQLIAVQGKNSVFTSQDFPYLEWEFQSADNVQYVYVRRREGERLPDHLVIPTKIGDSNGNKLCEVTSIEGFRACESIKKVEISGAKRIKILPDSFQGCKNLTSVSLWSIDELLICEGAFSHCPVLSYLYLGLSGIKKISNKSFIGCSLSLKERAELLKYQMENTWNYIKKKLHG